MATYNFKEGKSRLTAADVKSLYVNLIKARLARGMSATSETLVPSVQFDRVTDELMQAVTDETAKSSQQLNYRYQFPNYAAGRDYSHGHLIYKDWYNQIDVVTKDMARRADCSSGCIGSCVATCISTCQTGCSNGCQTSCSSGNCGNSCRTVVAITAQMRV